MDIRCPSCRDQVTVSFETSSTGIACSCGTSFSLVVDETLDHSVAVTGNAKTNARTIGGFELLEQIGQGGFGTVFKAYQKSLDRTVAIKIPRHGMLTDKDADRFNKEARAVAQLNHPLIVQVFEVGKENGTNFIASEFVEGMALNEWMLTHLLTSKEAAALVSKLCDALHHAHENGIVHRDLKPGNVMMDSADGPHVLDFGLARREVGEVTVTLEGQIFGTPAYMAPEQASGDGFKADRRADVYALGVILFELLTNEKPFRGSVTMVMNQVINDQPPSPRKLNATVPKDLETICLLCMEKSPEKRFSTAKILGDELNRFIRGKPIKSRPIGRAQQSWRWCKRNPKVSGLLAVVSMLLVSACFLGIYAEQKRQASEFNIKESSRKYRRNIGKAATVKAEGDIQLGDLYFEYGDTENALKWYEAAVRIAPPENRDRFKEILEEKASKLKTRFAFQTPSMTLGAIGRPE